MKGECASHPRALTKHPYADLGFDFLIAGIVDSPTNCFLLLLKLNLLIFFNYNVDFFESAEIICTHRRMDAAVQATLNQRSVPLPQMNVLR